MHRLMFSGSELVERPANCNTAYQWIPSDFAVSEGGEAGQDDVSAVRILSYINNLHPEQFVDLYDLIGTIFGHFVPLFERMLSDRAAGMRPALFDVDTITHDSWRKLPRHPAVPQEDSRLAFRAEIEEPPYQQSDDVGVAEIYGLFNDELLVQVLGAVQTSVSCCVAFPNWLQHQVQPFELEDSSKPGVRKILAFFLVDPEKPIASTSVIPPQQQKWVEPTLEAMVS